MKEFKEDELQQMVEFLNNYEEKVKEFAVDVRCENSVQVILKGHLYIEHEMRELLKKNLKYPQVLDCDKLKFSHLAKLVFSLGLLPIEIHQIVKKINKLRNDCAHNLKYNFGSTECRELTDTFSNDLNKRYLNLLQSYKEPITELIKLQVILSFIWGMIYEYSKIPDNIKEKLI